MAGYALGEVWADVVAGVAAVRTSEQAAKQPGLVSKLAFIEEVTSHLGRPDAAEPFAYLGFVGASYDRLGEAEGQDVAPLEPPEEPEAPELPAAPNRDLPA